jgi:hypothetical protein
MYKVRPSELLRGSVIDWRIDGMATELMLDAEREGNEGTGEGNEVYW